MWIQNLWVLMNGEVASRGSTKGDATEKMLGDRSNRPLCSQPDGEETCTATSGRALFPAVSVRVLQNDADTSEGLSLCGL